MEQYYGDHMTENEEGETRNTHGRN